MGREFWWDELEQILMTPAMLPEQLCLRLGDRVFKWEQRRWEQRRNEVEPRRRLLWSLYQWFLPLQAREQREGLAWLRVWAGVPVEVRASHRALWPREVRKLADSDFITVGAHSVTHPLLAHLPAAGQEAEIRESKATLEALLEGPVVAFSYPNGSATAETEVLVKEAGFALACTSDEDVVRRDSNPYHLPRFWVPDWDGATFGRWLERWLRD
jgi:hypothetical protein